MKINFFSLSACITFIFKSKERNNFENNLVCLKTYRVNTVSFPMPVSVMGLHANVTLGNTVEK